MLPEPASRLIRDTRVAEALGSVPQLGANPYPIVTHVRGRRPIFRPELWLVSPRGWSAPVVGRPRDGSTPWLVSPRDCRHGGASSPGLVHGPSPAHLSETRDTPSDLTVRDTCLLVSLSRARFPLPDESSALTAWIRIGPSDGEPM